MLEAEKGKCFAETAKKALEEKVQEIGIKLNAAEDELSVADGKLKEAERQIQLLKKEAKSYKDEVKETERERVALETREASLQDEVESGRREREEELACHERQLSDARRQQETVEGELKVVWKEMEEKQERWACDGIFFTLCDCHNHQRFAS